MIMDSSTMRTSMRNKRALNAQLATRNAVRLGVEQHQLGVDRHLWEKNDEELSVERYHLGVDQHQP